MTLGALIFSCGVGIGLRFLWHYFQGSGGGMIQSLVLAAALLIIGVQLAMMAMLADLVSANRKLGEETLVRLRRLEASADQRTNDQPTRSLNTRS